MSPLKRFIVDNLTARVISPTDVETYLRKSKGDDNLYHAAVLIILRNAPRAGDVRNITQNDLVEGKLTGDGGCSVEVRSMN